MTNEQKLRDEIESAIWSYQRQTGDDDFTGVIEINIDNGIVRDIWIDADEDDD